MVLVRQHGRLPHYIEGKQSARVYASPLRREVSWDGFLEGVLPTEVQLLHTIRAS